MTNKVLVVLMDAIEPSLVERWTDDGSLPVMKKMRAAGRFGRLTSELKLAGLPWLPLYTSRSDAPVPPYFLVWNPESMSLGRLGAEALDVPIFWRRLPEGGPRVVALDMPFVSRPVPFHGLEITAWMTHDTVFDSVQVHPEALKEYLEKFGGDLRFKEKYGAMHPAELRQVIARLIEMTDRVTDLALDLMAREPWDLFLAGYSTLHSAGHKLWDRTNVLEGRARQDSDADALRQVYVAADRSLGRLLAAAGPETRVLVLSVHGMVPNSSCNEILPEMLRRVLAGEVAGNVSSSGGLLQRMRRMIPYELRYQIKSRLPVRLQDFLTSFWRSGVSNWSRKKAFTVASDVQGMIRINLKGREREGIVQPGGEYEELCRKITDGLRTFVDAETGRPLVREVIRIEEALSGDGRPSFYPDLAVDWADAVAAAHGAVSSPLYGSIPWPTPGHNPDGRSGNHSMTGLFLAAGPGIGAGPVEGARAVDVAPTVLALLGQPVPDEMQGRPIPL